MSSAYIYHHLGLGDHIIANGMVRTIAKQYEKLYLFCKPHNLKNVSFMYRDLTHLQLISMDDAEVRSFMSITPDNNYIIAGHAPFWKILNSGHNTLQIDQIFYQLAGVPFENKWSEFYIQRDIEREKQVFKELILNEGEKYAFVHDSIERRITKNVPNMKIVKPENKDYSIFDFIYTIENASEIHCMNSSFFCLIDCLGIKNENMYLHEYVRKDINSDARGITKSPWKFL